MPDFNEVVTDPRLEKRTRRRFSIAEKKRLLAEADDLPHGEKGAWLRRKGLYADQLSTWRKDLAEHGEASLAARQPGRKPADQQQRGGHALQEFRPLKAGVIKRQPESERPPLPSGQVLGFGRALRSWLGHDGSSARLSRAKHTQQPAPARASRPERRSRSMPRMSGRF